MKGIVNTHSPMRADLQLEDFESLIQHKGREVVHHKSLQCPCKSKSTNQQSTCRNCGSTGWLFINPRRRKMIVTSLSISTDYKPWSEESRGTINFSSLYSSHVNFMDKITVIDGQSLHSESIHLRLHNGRVFGFLIYPPQHIHFLGLYTGANTGLQYLQEEGYTVNGNILEITNLDILPEEFVTKNNQNEIVSIDISITVRYSHFPSYLVMDVQRENLQSSKIVRGEESLQLFPISGIARRLHLELPQINLDTPDLIDNNIEEAGCVDHNSLPWSSGVENSDLSYTATVASGGTLILPDTEYIFTVGGVTEAPIFLPTLKNEIINIVWQ